LFTVDNFWDIFTAASGETVDGMTEVLDSLAKDAKAKGQLYFDFVLGGAPPTNENDWLRLRAFLLDWYASHQTIGSATSKITDPRTLSNSDIDELFRSFGYNYSPQLKGHDENPTDLKINFFLDLVNLYKRKGTPQAIVEVLQYYGVTKVDVYEFFIKLKNVNSLIFEGTAIAGTTTNPSKLIFEYERLTAEDPHWLYTEEQILQLQQTNDINLPSKTPYLGVRPIAAIDGAEIGILIRLVQDQFQYYLDNGVPPEANAEVSEIGEVVSLLELYLSVLYVFIKQYNVGQTGDSFICYDGTSSIITDIVDEFETATTKPLNRAEILSGLTTFYDGFTRENPRNFLQNKTDAEMFLTLINPSLKASLDSTTLTDSELLFSLMKDLSSWVRINLGYGFVNMGFIMFGLDSFFDDLKPVINFFKPYRARLLLLELLQISNPLFNTIIVEDDPEPPSVEFPLYEWLTANGNPCCTEENIDSTGPCTICLEDSTSNLYYARETYDCGSYHDIGAVSDIRQTDFFPFIEEIRHIPLVCIPPDLDSTAIVFNEVVQGEMIADGTSTEIITDSTSAGGLIYEEVTTGGFANFDGEQGDPTGYVYDPADGTSVIATLYENHSSGKFDCQTAFDQVRIKVYDETCYPSYTETVGPDYWDPVTGTWVVDRYESVGDNIILDTIDTTAHSWIDWRPSTMQLTFDNDDAQMSDMYAYDENNNMIMEYNGKNINVSNPIDLKIVYTEPYNFRRLYINDNNSFDVVSIEFYENCKDELISIVSDGADDGWAYDDGSGFNSSDTHNRMGISGSDKAIVWYRFQNVEIPPNSTINSALIKWNVYSGSTVATVTTKIQCELVADSTAPISGIDVINKPLTTAFVQKSLFSLFVIGWVIDKWYVSANFKTALQEVIDQGGWSSGNAVTVFLYCTSSQSNAHKDTKSYDSYPEYGAELWVDFSTP